MQGVRAIDYPLVEDRGILRRMAAGNRPMIDPVRTLFSDIVVGQTVGGIAQRIL